MRDLEGFENTPLFRKMLADAPAMLKEVSTFNQQYAGLIKSDHAAVGTILRCHLVVEHYLNEYLAEAHPGISDFTAARLSFAQKLSLANHPKTVVAFIMPALKSLNKLRNELAYKLDVDLSTRVIQPIEDFVKLWNEAAGHDVPRGLAAVQNCTQVACIFLSGATGTMKRHGKGARLNWSVRVVCR
jgi:hypothetical protein